MPDLTDEEIFERLKKPKQPSESEEDFDWDQLAKEIEEWEKQTLKKEGLIPPIDVISAKKLLETDYPQETWLIDKFLAEESICLIVGEAGTFKSYLSLYIAKCLVTKEPFLGHFTVLKPSKILFIDKENKLRRIQKRMRGLNYPLTEDILFLAYPQNFMFGNKLFMKDVTDYVKKNAISVVILDSFIDMFEGNENSSTDTAKAFNALRSISSTATFIALHHDSKPMPKLIRSAAQKTRGSSNIIAQVDTQYYFEKGKDLKTLIVEQGKSRDEEPIKKFVVEIVTEVEKGIVDFSYKEEFKSDIKKIEEAANWLYSQIQLNSMVSKEDLLELGESEGFSQRIIQDALSIVKSKGLIDSVKQPGHGNKAFYIPLIFAENGLSELDES